MLKDAPPITRIVTIADRQQPKVSKATGRRYVPAVAETIWILDGRQATDAEVRLIERRTSRARK